MDSTKPSVSVRLARALVSLNPWLFINIIHDDYRNLAAVGLNRPLDFELDPGSLPNQIEDFADLSPLFWLSPLNRGVIRQDLDEASALYRLVRSLSNPRGIEIGRFSGGSRILLAAAVGPGGTLLSIDRAPRNDDALQKALQHCGLEDRVELVTADSGQVELEDSVDFVFIDGDHTYEGAKRDHDCWAHRVKVGGYLVYHDMASQRRLATQKRSLRRLRDEILTHTAAFFDLTTEVGSISIWQRIGHDWESHEEGATP